MNFGKNVDKIYLIGSSVVSGCLEGSEENPCSSSPCLNLGRCSLGWNRYICDCRNTDWTGSTCAKPSPKITLDGGSDGISFEFIKQLQALDLSIRFRTNRASGKFVFLR